MASKFWPKALVQACFHAYHPGLYSCDPESITSHFLWRWGEYPSAIWPVWERIFVQGQEDDGRFAQDIFPILQRAVTEGQEEDRVFALFLVGALATPEARELLSSFLASAHRKERWASAISLGRLKDERVFALLQTFLLEGFSASEIFASVEELQAAQEAGRLYRRTLAERGRAECSETFWRVNEHLQNIDYEWYLRQRSECALVLGAWGNAVVVPKLREALQAAWRMEQAWPNYEGPNESGPDIWHVFQDYLAFALGQFGAWDAPQPLHLPDGHLLVARIYLILGYLQVSDPMIFYGERTSTLFRDSPEYLRHRAWMEEKGMEVDPFVDPVRVKPLLAEHFGLSPAEQEDYLVRFHKAWYERAKEKPVGPSPLSMMQ